MIIKDVMDQVATRLDTVENLRVFAYPVDKGPMPFAAVDFPDSYDFDETYGRGLDRLTLPLLLSVPRVVDRTLPNQMSDYASGSGPRSVKAVLESGTYTAFDTIRVVRAEFDWSKNGDEDCLTAEFTLDIAGRGSEY